MSSESGVTAPSLNLSLITDGLKILADAGGEFIEDDSTPTSLAGSLYQAVQQGFAERSLFANLFTCPRCVSTDLRIIERCVGCHSIDIEAEALLHHCACAEVFHARTFDKHDVKKCPKCQCLLEESPAEFEDAGFIYRCNSCSRIDAEPVVSFSCGRCREESAGAIVSKHRFYRYSLSAAGKALLQSISR
jgi:Thaumarchaeal output domain 1